MLKNFHLPLRVVSMILRSDRIQKVSGLLFEAIILAFIIGCSWMDVHSGDTPAVHHKLTYNATSLDPVILRDISIADLLKSPVAKVQKSDIESSAFDIDNPSSETKNSQFLFTSFLERIAFYTFISINAP